MDIISFNPRIGNDGVLYELVSLVILSLVYYGIGIWLFKRRHMQIS
jgi:hypothetical protein